MRPFRGEVERERERDRQRERETDRDRERERERERGGLDQSPAAQLGLTVGLGEADSQGHMTSVV